METWLLSMLFGSESLNVEKHSYVTTQQSLTRSFDPKIIEQFILHNIEEI